MSDAVTLGLLLFLGVGGLASIGYLIWFIMRS